MTVDATEQPSFVISLDCELGWGHLGDPDDDRWAAVHKDRSAVRESYRQLLSLFEEYRVPATWAIVGHLFVRSCSTETHHRTVQTQRHDPHTDRDRDPLYYGDDIIEMIAEADLPHDVGGHGFSHVPFTEMDREGAATEIGAMVDAAADHDLELRSFVFPQNCIAHRDLLADAGIEVYRGETVGGNHTFKSGVRALLGRDDMFLRCPPVAPEKDEFGLTRVRASRFLRDERWWWLQPHRFRSSLRSMRPGQLIHLTLHPHNLVYDRHLMRTIDTVLSTVAESREQEELQVRTMAEVASDVPGN